MFDIFKEMSLKKYSKQTVAVDLYIFWHKVASIMLTTCYRVPTVIYTVRDVLLSYTVRP